MTIAKFIKHLPLLASAVLCSFLCLGVNTARSATAPVKSLTVSCGDTQMTLQCTDEDCGTTTLRLNSIRRQSTKIGRPEGMERYTAVGLACAKATNGTPYFIVQYGELPYGCAFCEWFHLYTVHGQLLTRSVPAILTDTSAPEGQGQAPNNAQFDALDRKLGLSRPKIRYINSP